jgi:diguanylate cyclase (GGDEF)-like protein
MRSVGSQIGQYDVRTRAEAALAAALARLRAQHAELRGAVRRLSRLAVTDGLTGIPNHRAFRRRLDQAVAEAARGRRLALLFADIDHFKALNDRFGHLTGDRVLRAVAAALTEGARRSDVVARYGGEEFAVICADLAAAAAADLAERLRARVAALRGPAHPVTISIGVATWDDRMRLPERLIAAADRALYEAKRRGRNRVCVAKRARS